MTNGQTEHYLGAMLVSDDSYLRRLPVGLHPENRLRMDAIVVASDIVSQCYQDLSRLGAEIGATLGQIGYPQRAAFIGLAWSIVDQLHAVRQLVTPPTGTPAGPATQRFLDAAEPATLLRNKMDHLKNNLSNLSAKKGERYPLFGAISYVLSNPDPQSGGLLMTVSSGALHGGDLFPAVNPAGRSYSTPVGLLQLSAFYLTFEFSPALAALQDYLAITEAGTEKKMRAAAEAEAEKGVHTVEELLAHLGGSPVVAMAFDYTNDPVFKAETTAQNQ